jgi:hypothetical protein
MTTKLKPTDSLVCECGKKHPLGPYVAAHWNEELIHSCECGRKHTIRAGLVKLIDTNRKHTNRKPVEGIAREARA